MYVSLVLVYALLNRLSEGGGCVSFSLLRVNPKGESIYKDVKTCCTCKSRQVNQGQNFVPRGPDS